MHNDRQAGRQADRRMETDNQTPKVIVAAGRSSEQTHTHTHTSNACMLYTHRGREGEGERVRQERPDGEVLISEVEEDHPDIAPVTQRRAFSTCVTEGR